MGSQDETLRGETTTEEISPELSLASNDVHFVDEIGFSSDDLEPVPEMRIINSHREEIYLHSSFMNQTKHFATAEQKTNVPLAINT